MDNHLEIAFAEYGTKEITGSKHNPEVLKYFQETGHKWVKDDETAWCSAFANWICYKAGLEKSNKLDARSWLKFGTPVDIPKLGDIVVFWRKKPNSWMGHVAFFIRETKDFVYVLGGNQSNQVKISAYPKHRLLGYRRLKKV